MKGQYLAIEAVFTFGIGIVIALAVVSSFNSYSESTTSSSIEKEATVITSEVKDSILHLKNTDSGEKTIDLPEEIGGRDYSLAIDNGVKVFSNRENYSSNFNGLERYSFEGTVDGGTVKLYKTDNSFILRPE